MTDIAWHDTDDIENRLPAMGNSIDQNTLTDILEEAHVDATSVVGTYVVEKLRPTYDEQESFDLAFRRIHSLDRVEVDDDLVADSNYTVTKAPANITFNSDWAEDNLHGLPFRLYAIYIPKDVVQLELALAMEQALELVVAQTRDGDDRAQADNWHKRVERKIKAINRKAANLSDGERGRTLASNQRRTDQDWS